MLAFREAMRTAACLIEAITDVEPALFTAERKGSPHVVQARHLLVYLLHTEGQYQQQQIAAALHRHHSTIANSIEVVSELREDSAYDAALEKLCAIYRQLIDARQVIAASDPL